MFKQGDKIGLVSCSNGQPIAHKEKIDRLVGILKDIGLLTVCSPYIFAREGAFGGTGEERAEVLMKFYKDPEIKAIFDVSGGDIANEVLSHLDFKVIRDHPKSFWGYSDLTTIVNAIFAQTGKESFLYQIRNLVGDCSREQIKRFRSLAMGEGEELLDADFYFIQGEQMEGIVIGGNIRCFLKLAGTPFMPSFKDRILFLEAMGGEVPQMTTYLNQLKQMGAFKEVKGILLGTFAAMERNDCTPKIEELVVKTIGNPSLPIAKTSEIGHGPDSKALVIGRKTAISV